MDDTSRPVLNLLSNRPRQLDFETHLVKEKLFFDVALGFFLEVYAYCTLQESCNLYSYYRTHFLLYIKMSS